MAAESEKGRVKKTDCGDKFQCRGRIGGYCDGAEAIRRGPARDADRLFDTYKDLCVKLSLLRAARDKKNPTP